MRLIQGFDANGNPVARNSTPAEDANLATLIAAANTAIQTNIDALALTDPTAANNTYLGLANPSTQQQTAQIRALTNQSNAVVAQARALTRQNTAVIRLLVGVVDSTAGT